MSSHATNALSGEAAVDVVGDGSLDGDGAAVTGATSAVGVVESSAVSIPAVETWSTRSAESHAAAARITTAPSAQAQARSWNRAAMSQAYYAVLRTARHAARMTPSCRQSDTPLPGSASLHVRGRSSRASSRSIRDRARSPGRCRRYQNSGPPQQGVGLRDDAEPSFLLLVPHALWQAQLVSQPHRLENAFNFSAMSPSVGGAYGSVSHGDDRCIRDG